MTHLKLKQNALKNNKKALHNCAQSVSSLIQKTFDNNQPSSVRLYHPKQEYKPNPVPQHILDIINISVGGQTNLSVRYWDSVERARQGKSNFPKHLDDLIHQMFNHAK